MANGENGEEDAGLAPLKARIEELRSILRGFSIAGDGVSGAFGSGYSVDRGGDIVVDVDPIDNCD